MIIGILLFILLLGALVLVHEWGHFIVARRLGVKVEEFAFGFPPRIASIVRGGTRYALNLFPIGGYVKIFGESGTNDDKPESFSSRPLWQRFSIIAAGVLMNVVLAWALFSAGHALGLPTVVADDDAAEGARVTIIGISPNSPAERAGIQFGDAISEFTVGGAKFAVNAIEDVQRFVDQHRGEEVIIKVKRGSEEISTDVAPRLNPPPGEGALGIAMARVGIVRSPVWRAPWDGAKTTASAVVGILTAFGHALKDLFSQGKVTADVSGPVGIFMFADQTRRLGISYLIELAGILSINLAILNFLPIPALDGGRVLFLFIEKVRGARVNQRLEHIVHTIGFAVLLTLMLAITYRDIVRIL